MTTEATKEKMKKLRLGGMLQAYTHLTEKSTDQGLSLQEMLALLVDAEWDTRYNRRMQRLLKDARLGVKATFETVECGKSRNLERTHWHKFLDCGWVGRNENIIITGPTGAGKSHIACALGHLACLKGYKVLYLNCLKFFGSLKASKADGSFAKEISRLKNKKLLILDDFGLQALDTAARMALLELLEDRLLIGSLIISSQIPNARWHEIIGEATIADAICDRLFHTAHRIELMGESRRKRVIPDHSGHP